MSVTLAQECGLLTPLYCSTCTTVALLMNRGILISVLYIA